MAFPHNLSSLDATHLWHPFDKGGAPLVIARAEGSVLYDEAGRGYQDLISSWWVVTHGHRHPAIMEAIHKQSERLSHVLFAGVTHEGAVRVAEHLARVTPSSLQRVFFSDNGSCAVEIALKMAWLYWRKKGKEPKHFLALEGGYHGDTMGAMAAGVSCQLYEGFESLLYPFHFTSYPETWLHDNEMGVTEERALETLSEHLHTNGHTLNAVILEPLVQGASGMRMSSRRFFNEAIAMIRAKSDALIIFDEVMTAFGRLGSLFASDQLAHQPDILCCAKGLTGGTLPLAATVIQNHIYEAFAHDGGHFFAHGHSYTANPLACAAALASLQLFDSDDTWTRIRAIEHIHHTAMQDIMTLPHITKPRIMGTIAAFTIDGKDEGYHATIGRAIGEEALRRGLLLRPLGNVVYMMPPYCIAPQALREAWQQLNEILAQFMPHSSRH